MPWKKVMGCQSLIFFYLLYPGHEVKSLRHYHGLTSNESNRPWTETLKTVSQNKLSSLQIDNFRYFGTEMEG
jgi:hypothetical protein